LIVALLYAHQRSMRRVLTVLAPLAAAVAGTTAILLLAGVKLTLFHLVALLLVVGVGSNYALFFERKAASEAESRRAAFAVVLCAATTIIAFGLLASSHLPVLKMIGATAALGAFASLVCSALVADREREA
jgi:predicted exporter